MLDREPFLKAIFADPGNDLPRLVFADYLEEDGDPVWADVIRIQCELARDPDAGGTAAGRLRDRLRGLLDQLPDAFAAPNGQPRLFDRGFRAGRRIEVTVAELADPDRLRRRASTEEPEWYGATRLKVIDGRILSPAPLATIFTSPVTAHVTDLDLSGREVPLPAHPTDPAADGSLPAFDIEVRPVISVAMVEVLARTREARRLTELDLTNNGLDNEAAMVLVRSPHLFRLRRLAFHMGNHLKARTWQRLIDRFGDIVQ